MFEHLDLAEDGGDVDGQVELVGHEAVAVPDEGEVLHAQVADPVDALARAVGVVPQALAKAQLGLGNSGKKESGITKPRFRSLGHFLCCNIEHLVRLVRNLACKQLFLACAFKNHNVPYCVSSL